MEQAEAGTKAGSQATAEGRIMKAKKIFLRLNWYLFIVLSTFKIVEEVVLKR
jgi:hypothetical protein